MSNANIPRKLPQQQRAQLTVNTILDATAHILIERGFAKTNTNIVAERAGVSIGSLYQYFPNKESLIKALYQRHKKRMQSIIFNAMKKPIQLNDHHSIFLLIDAIVKAHLIEPALHLRFDEIKNIDDWSKIGEDDMNSMQTLLEQLLQNQTEQSIQHNYKLIAFMLTRTVHTLVHAIVFELPTNNSMNEMIEEVICIINGYLKGYTERADELLTVSSSQSS